MWRSCVDIIAISNMLRMSVECIVHEVGSVPVVYKFSPDQDFPFLDEDIFKPKDPTELKYPKMTVLNYKNNHFNLIVEKDSMIAQIGSFSFQRKLEKNRNINQVKSTTTLETKLYQKIDNLEKALKDKIEKNTKLKEQVLTKQKPSVVNEIKCEDCNILFSDKETLKKPHQ